MITYRQLLKSSGKTRKNLWYLCGSDASLVNDAVEIAKMHVCGGISSVCLGVFFGTSSSKEDLTDFIQRPYYEERKLIIVYDVAKVGQIESIVDLSDTSTFYILVDYGPANHTDAFDKLITNNTKARAVECKRADDTDLLAVVNSRLNISDGAARKLVANSNGNHEWLLNKIRILEHLDTDTVSQKLVELVCTDAGVPNFEDSLIQFDKRQSFLYIKDIGTDNISVNKIIDDTHTLSLLNLAVGQYNKQTRPIIDSTGLSKAVVDKYLDKASYYDTTTSRGCFELVTRLHKRLLTGDKLAYMALVSGW